MDKLDIIKEKLERAALPETGSDDYWVQVGLGSNNAVDYICDMDDLVKELLTIINER